MVVFFLAAKYLLTEKNQNASLQIPEFFNLKAGKNDST